MDDRITTIVQSVENGFRGNTSQTEPIEIIDLLYRAYAQLSVVSLLFSSLPVHRTMRGIMSVYVGLHHCMHYNVVPCWSCACCGSMQRVAYRRNTAN